MSACGFTIISIFRLGLLCQWKHEIFKNMCDPLPCMPLEVARTTIERGKGDPKFILYANEEKYCPQKIIINAT